jgi:transcriptional regulator with XRE-family HTH domain
MVKPKRTTGATGNYSPKKAFGLAFRRIRARKGLTQTQLADRAGYHRNLVSLIERGEANLSLMTLFDMAATLGIPPSKIVRATERLVDRAARTSRRV